MDCAQLARDPRKAIRLEISERDWICKEKTLNETKREIKVCPIKVLGPSGTSKRWQDRVGEHESLMHVTLISGPPKNR